MGDMKRFLSKAGPLSLKKSSRKIKIKGKEPVKFDRKKVSINGKIKDDGTAAAGVVVEDSVQSQGCKKMFRVGCLVVIG
jgi:hypothetical protein